MYKIGEFSKMGKTTIKTLRFYDETGILKPEKIDDFTNYRMYTSAQLIKLHNIQSLRQIGLSIEEIRQILAGKNADGILENRKAWLALEMEKIRDQLSRVEFILSTKQEEKTMNYQAKIKEIPECVVYTKELTVPDYSSYFELIPKIGEQLTSKYPDIKCKIPEYCYIVYLDGEYKEKDFKILFCEAVEEMREDFDDIYFKNEEPVTVVSVMHKGPYSTLSSAYAYALKWIEENGYKASDNPRESYIDGIWNKEDENDWLTELQIPVVK